MKNAHFVSKSSSSNGANQSLCSLSCTVVRACGKLGTLVALPINYLNKFRRTSIFQNINENIVRISALKVFIASLGLLGSFVGLSVGFLINDITY